MHKTHHYRIKKQKNYKEETVSAKINTFIDLLGVSEAVKEDLFQEGWLFYLQSTSSNPDVGARLHKLWKKAQRRHDRGDMLEIMPLGTHDICDAR